MEETFKIFYRKTMEILTLEEKAERAGGVTNRRRN